MEDKIKYCVERRKNERALNRRQITIGAQSRYNTQVTNWDPTRRVVKGFFSRSVHGRRWFKSNMNPLIFVNALWMTIVRFALTGSKRKCDSGIKKIKDWVEKDKL